MTVQELIDQLLLVEDKSRLVIMQSDGEGNRMSPLSDFSDNAVYDDDNTWGGEVGLQTLTTDLVGRGYTKADLGSGVPCLVLYPTN